ncbi:MAG: serine/threonine-protein kinase [Acidobacteriota bacterium]
MPPVPTPGGARIAPDSVTAGAFTPGAVIADRYRVIGLLGRGGMGEVYRADDLKLGTAVALKFLPRAIAADPSRYQRFLEEVRLSREVSHPNVCRVHDIAEFAGMHFLSMEYIDGEDCASLLKRIGRLPADKALDVARQTAAGLAAAHHRGILHRDLKPANIMLDGRGRVRITDFGLAVGMEASPSAHDASGTPAYMAPEQFAGEAATVRSDIYALGLVLYELYTGRRAFSAASLEELIDRKRHEVPPAPATLVNAMDPAVDRVIMASIASDPHTRPATVAEIMAQLPGGNLLEAAVLAGQTPSPELVAAAGTNEGLSTAVAWVLVGVLVLGASLATIIGDQAILWRRAALERSPDALAERARDILVRLGYADGSPNRASGFETDLEYLRYIRAHDSSRARWNQVNPSFFRFWYRESPQPLESWRFVMRYGNFSRVDPIDPPLDVAGMTRVTLDPTGKLVDLVVVPPPVDEPTASRAPPDWAALLATGGYDHKLWRPVEPRRTPPVYADARAAWEGTWPSRPDLHVRLEAAALHGRPTYFEAHFPWSQPARVPTAMLNTAERTAVVLFVVIAAGLTVAAAALASRNVRAGRGDRLGAFRLSAFIFGCIFVAWFFAESHVPSLGEATLLAMAVSWALLVAGCCWVGYLATEPFVRRQWPQVLVSWTRLLGGRVRDPQVGRDVLAGCAAGTWLAVLGLAAVMAPGWFGRAPDVVPADIIGAVYGPQRVVPLLLWRSAQSVFTGLSAVFVLVVLRVAIGRRALAIAALVALVSIAYSLASEYFWITLAGNLVLNTFFVLLLVRVGLLAAVVAFYVSGVFIVFPVTVEFSRWYAGAGVSALMVVAGLATIGFMNAVRRRTALA